MEYRKALEGENDVTCSVTELYCSEGRKILFSDENCELMTKIMSPIFGGQYWKRNRVNRGPFGHLDVCMVFGDGRFGWWELAPRKSPLDV